MQRFVKNYISNFGLQDAQNASSANCFALRDAHCGKPSTQEESAALKIFYIAIPAKNVAKAHPIIVLLVDAPEVEHFFVFSFLRVFVSHFLHFFVSSFLRFLTSWFPRFFVSLFLCFFVSSFPRFFVSSFLRFLVSSLPRFLVFSGFFVSFFLRFLLSSPFSCIFAWFWNIFFFVLKIYIF